MAVTKAVQTSALLEVRFSQYLHNLSSFRLFFKKQPQNSASLSFPAGRLSRKPAIHYTFSWSLSVAQNVHSRFIITRSWHFEGTSMCCFFFFPSGHISWLLDISRSDSREGYVMTKSDSWNHESKSDSLFIIISLWLKLKRVQKKMKLNGTGSRKQS